jgi:hypothetical protein
MTFLSRAANEPSQSALSASSRRISSTKHKNQSEKQLLDETLLLAIDAPFRIAVIVVRRVPDAIKSSPAEGMEKATSVASRRLHQGSCVVKDPVFTGLEILAEGLRPFVSQRIETVLKNPHLAKEVTSWDAQALMVFIWERWNDVFRAELTFLERSLVSELREFRNRWAHQDALEESDIYRVLDDIERLLKATRCPEAYRVRQLRIESLGRLWADERTAKSLDQRARLVWPYIICGACALALNTAILAFGSAPWDWLLSGLVFLGMMRVAYVQATRESLQGPGPHECSRCGRIVYSTDCPYCNPSGLEQPQPATPRRSAEQPETLVSGAI